MPRRGSYFTPAPNYISVSPSLVNSITIHPVLQTKILLSQPQFLTLPLGLSSSDCSSAQNTFPLLAKFYLSLKEQLGWRFLCEALKKTNKHTSKQTNTFSFLVEIRKLHPGAPSPRTKESPQTQILTLGFIFPLEDHPSTSFSNSNCYSQKVMSCKQKIYVGKKNPRRKHV